MPTRPRHRVRGGYTSWALSCAAVACCLAGCGAATSRSVQQAHLPALDTATLPHLGLIAVLQSSTSRQGSVYDSVALVDAQGRVVNRAGFVPRQPPYSGESEAILPPAAIVAAGSVWVLDGSGAVLRLGPSGPAQTVARFPAPAPGAASLAVSPDGSRLLSSAYTAAPTASQPAGGNPVEQPAPGAVTLRAAALGRADTMVLRTVDGPVDQPPVSAGDPSETVGLVESWDEVGPVEALHPPPGTQDYAPRGFQSPLANVDPATGAPTAYPIGGAGCVAVDELANGVTLCTALPTNIPAPPVVRDRGGHLLFVADVPPSTQSSPSFSPRLSPDGTRVAMALQSLSLPPNVGRPAQAAVVGYDGQVTRLAAGCQPVGWAEVAVVVCAPSPTNTTAPGSGALSVVHLQAAGTQVPLGVSGVFVGAL